MLTDIEIAQRANIKPIKEIAEGLSIDEDDLNYYGKYKAKLSESLFKKLKSKKDGKLILVTAINPTPAGEGKTTITIGLGQAMSKLGKKAIVALREPSLGPVFGLKGGATGGGYSQVIPMEDINLHFTGDMHSVTAANNLLCAMLDNHLQQGNKLNIDVKQILVRRCLDINDRALRNIVIGLGGKMNAVPREDSFIITVASEVMAILCLAKDLKDLKEKLGNILIAYSNNNEPIFAKDINANGAMATLLKDAINPNLVQTLDGTPAIIHGGPFANIAHGCNSIRATKLSLKLADYCITEAGFGSDLGAEKFFDIKCRIANLKPAASVLVATVRALKYNGGIDKNELHFKNLKALKLGIKNLSRHIDILKRFNVPIVVAINKFDTDTKDELKFIEDFCREKNVSCSIADAYSGGADGCIDLANKLFKVVEKNKLKFSQLYPLEKTIKEKIEIICNKIYGAKNVIYTPEAHRAIEKINSLNGDNLPVCIAKTQYSFSDDQTLLGAPTDFYITIRDAKISNGAGFVVVYTGNIMTMPGLPKVPAANDIDISCDGKVTGLF